MDLVCHMILQDHPINGVILFFGLEPLIVSHHPAKFGGHRHCGSGK